MEKDNLTKKIKKMCKALESIFVQKRKKKVDAEK